MVTNRTPAKEAVNLYRDYIVHQKHLMSAIPELYGKVLGCWCKKTPDAPCHGDVLVELATQRLMQEYEVQRDS